MTYASDPNTTKKETVKKNNTKARVLQTIKGDPSGDWTAREIAEKIGQKPDNVAYHLRSLVKDGSITKVGPGRYTTSKGEKTLPAPVVTQAAKQIDTAAITAALWSELLHTEVNTEMVAVLNRVQEIVTTTH